MMINEKQFQKWINALYSGKYQQGKFALQTKDGYCCLGVACKVLIPEAKLRMKSKFLWGAMPTEQPKAPEWLELINNNFSDKMGTDLTYLNDYKDMSFEEIGMVLDLVYINKAL